MIQPNRIWFAVFAAALLLPSRAAAQSATVTDDAFLSSNAATQQLNLNGQGTALIVAGSSAAVGNSNLGTTKTYIKFQLQSSLPPSVAAANVAKATLKLYLSPAANPSGTIDFYLVTSAWTESTLSVSSPPTLVGTPFVSVPVGKANSFVVIDLTTQAQEWLKASANGGFDNNGIALVANTSTTYAVFDSKESVVTSHEPRLEIVLANSGPAGPAATVAVGATMTLGPNGQAAVTNSGTPNAAILNFFIPQGQSGAAGPAGPAATVQVGSTMTVPAGTPASVLNGGNSSAAVLNFLIPQGQPGATGPQGPVGISNLGAWNSATAYNKNDAVFDSASYWLATTANTNSEPSPTNTNWQLLAAGINNRGTWSPSNSYNINDAVSDQGSFWLALQAIQAKSAEPSSTNASWQLLAAQGPQGQTGAQGLQGIQGPMGMQGPPGPMPVGAALTTTPNTFAASQTISGSLILSGAGAAIQFADGTQQTTAAIGGGIPSGYMIMGLNPAAPPGFTASGTMNTGDSWALVAPMPTPRAGLAVANLNGKIYAIGGYDSSGPSNIVEVYDPTTNTWSTAASMPTARGGLAAAALNGRIYAIGGASGGRGSVLNTVEMYDPASDTWSGGPIAVICFHNCVPPPPNLPAERVGPAAVTVNGKIYVIGGDDNLSSVNTVYIYDLSTNAWSNGTSVPTVREQLAAAAANGKIYVMGGITNGVVVNTMEVYDPTTNAWSTVASMPLPRYGVTAAELNGKIYSIGGFDSSFNKLSIVHVYDPIINTWSVAAPALVPTSGIAAAAANGRIFALGGLGGGSAELYSPPGTVFTFVKN